jgi:hypothetical protein
MLFPDDLCYFCDIALNAPKLNEDESEQHYDAYFKPERHRKSSYCFGQPSGGFFLASDYLTATTTLGSNTPEQRLSSCPQSSRLQALSREMRPSFCSWISSPFVFIGASHDKLIMLLA